MKQVSVIIYLSLVLSAIVFGADIGNSLLLFMAAGIIPGTNLIVPSSVTLAVILATISLVIFKSIRYIVFPYHQKSTKSKKRLPRRRFSSI